MAFTQGWRWGRSCMRLARQRVRARGDKIRSDQIALPDTLNNLSVNSEYMSSPYYYTYGIHHTFLLDTFLLIRDSNSSSETIAAGSLHCGQPSNVCTYRRVDLCSVVFGLVIHDHMVKDEMSCSLTDTIEIESIERAMCLIRYTTSTTSNYYTWKFQLQYDSGTVAGSCSAFTVLSKNLV